MIKLNLTYRRDFCRKLADPARVFRGIRLIEDFCWAEVGMLGYFLVLFLTALVLALTTGAFVTAAVNFIRADFLRLALFA